MIHKNVRSRCNLWNGKKWATFSTLCLYVESEKMVQVNLFTKIHKTGRGEDWD